MTTTTADGWHKSSLSVYNGNCVEAREMPDGAMEMRNSREPGGVVLSFTPEQWDHFTAGVKASEFDRRLAWKTRWLRNALTALRTPLKMRGQGKPCTHLRSAALASGSQGAASTMEPALRLALEPIAWLPSETPHSAVNHGVPRSRSRGPHGGPSSLK